MSLLSTRQGKLRTTVLQFGGCNIQQSSMSEMAQGFWMLSTAKVYGPLFPAERTITGDTYPGMLEKMSTTATSRRPRRWFGLPTRWGLFQFSPPCKKVPGSDLAWRIVWTWWVNWLTPKDATSDSLRLFLVGVPQGSTPFTIMPGTVNELKTLIRIAVGCVSIQMLQNMWMEQECRLHTCSVACGA
jgi:hypothetical protein